MVEVLAAKLSRTCPLPAAAVHYASADSTVATFPDREQLDLIGAQPALCEPALAPSADPGTLWCGHRAARRRADLAAEQTMS
ncbi:MAG TPA: hypothetical protein VFF32_03370 [Dermatophilaceae bacterium]|nr:hypothetical protein [Dermatophilaceae bacterium]